ncbi:unnamed protein product [Rhizoctonia solani]|nr:unnamed protein product [Rhizoctonia solani]
MSLPRFGEPSRHGRGYHHNDLLNNQHTVYAHPATATNLSGILSTDRLSTRSQILPNTYSQRYTDAPASYVHEYEREIARWQTRRRAKERRSELLLSCSVCLEAMEPSVWVRPTAGCGHEPRICEACLGQYVMHGIREGSTEVLCPDVGCRRQMDRKDVMGYIRGDPGCLKRYHTLVAQRELERQPNFVWCQNPRCGRGQVHDKGDASPLVICHYCRSRSCFTHRILWHRGLTCEGYDLVILHGEEMQASEDYIGKHTKQCPNCRRPIEKITGCDHMTCLSPWGCGHEFCWVCLASYGDILRDGSHRHNPDCRYYANIWANDQGVPEYIPPGYIPQPRIDLLPTPGPVHGWLRELPEEAQLERPPTPPTPTSLRQDDWEDPTEGEMHRWVWQPAPSPLSTTGTNVIRTLD